MLLLKKVKCVKIRWFTTKIGRKIANTNGKYFQHAEQ